MSNKINFIYIKKNDTKENFELIYKNEANYKKDETDIVKLKSNYVDFEKSIEKLKKTCEIMEVNQDEFMELAVKLIKLDDYHIGDMKDVCAEW